MKSKSTTAHDLASSSPADSIGRQVKIASGAPVLTIEDLQWRRDQVAMKFVESDEWLTVAGGQSFLLIQ